MTKEEGNTYEESSTKATVLPRVNFRPLLFCALGLVFGIFLYTKIRFGGLAVSDFLFLALFLFFALLPFQKRRFLIILISLTLFAGAGALSVHLNTAIYTGGMEAGTYTVTGEVLSISQNGMQGSVLLGEVTFDGRKEMGKMRVGITVDGVETGDLISFTAHVSRTPLPAGDGYSEYCFEKDIRYEASPASFTVTGKSGNLFLRLRARLYTTLHSSMEEEGADLAYGLLTGDTGRMDGGLKEAVQKGGIAHIFAVSGLHIGMLYAAVYFLFRFLNRYACFPALAAALLYCAFCGFSVSSVRAVVMCAVLSVYRFIGRKTDFLQSISLAAILILLFFPAQWLSAGFRLSFGACLGLALFSGTFTRAFARVKFPKFLANTLSAGLSVQIFTFPVMIESFGYFPVWGILLNLVLIPVLPVLFITLFVCTLLALIIPPAAGVFLFLPSGAFALLPYLFRLTDLSFVLTGFSLGAGGVVWLTANAVLSEKVRMKGRWRAVFSGGFCILFTLCLLGGNLVPSGCKIAVEGNASRAGAALVQSDKATVLILDGNVSLSRCEDFLACNYGGKLDAVIVLSDDELSGINTGAFLNTKAVYAYEQIETGLKNTNVIFGEHFVLDDLSFRYESREKIYLTAEGRAVEFDFTSSVPLGGDLFVEKSSGGLKYFLRNGIIKAL